MGKKDKSKLIALIDDEIDKLNMNLVINEYYSLPEEEKEKFRKYKENFLDEINNIIFKNLFDNNLNSYQQKLHTHPEYETFLYLDEKLLKHYYQILKQLNQEIEGKPEFYSGQEAFQSKISSITKANRKNSKGEDLQGHFNYLANDGELKKCIKRELENKNEWEKTYEIKQGRIIKNLDSNRENFEKNFKKYNRKEKELNNIICNYFGVSEPDRYYKEAFSKFKKGFYGYRNYNDILEESKKEFLKLPKKYGDAIDSRILKYQDLQFDFMHEYINHFYKEDYEYYISKCYYLGKAFKDVFEERNGKTPLEYLKELNGYNPNIEQLSIADCCTNKQIWGTEFVDIKGLDEKPIKSKKYFLTKQEKELYSINLEEKLEISSYLIKKLYNEDRFIETEDLYEYIRGSIFAKNQEEKQFQLLESDYNEKGKNEIIEKMLDENVEIKQLNSQDFFEKKKQIREQYPTVDDYIKCRCIHSVSLERKRLNELNGK